MDTMPTVIDKFEAASKRVILALRQLNQTIEDQMGYTITPDQYKANKRNNPTNGYEYKKKPIRNVYIAGTSGQEYTLVFADNTEVVVSREARLNVIEPVITYVVVPISSDISDKSTFKSSNLLPENVKQGLMVVNDSRNTRHLPLVIIQEVYTTLEEAKLAATFLSNNMDMNYEVRKCIKAK